MFKLSRSLANPLALCAGLLAGAAHDATADVIADWNARSADIVVEAKLGTPPAIRVMALAHAAAYDAVKAVGRAHSQAAVLGNEGFVEAAVASANRVVLSKLLPAQQSSIETIYRNALAQIPDDVRRAEGIAIGERAAAAVLARRLPDGLPSPDVYRPMATAGGYVPTSSPAAFGWGNRKPWLMTSPQAFRPGPPPALTSDTWARDYNEVKAIGARASTRRTAEQTEIARFWEYSLPQIYFGVVRSVAQLPDRDVTANARLFAAVAMAMDDAMIAVFEAKYHYGFWRPVTAIRNGDHDGNNATERDAGWSSFSEAPLHPEYPSAHSILAAAVGSVLEAELRGKPATVLTTSSPTAKGASRSWTRIDDFVREVAEARIYEGIHFRTSTEAGIAMGKGIGGLAVQQLLDSRP